ncbi:hypothetical protein [Flavobacterium sp. 3HN19-14]|uniref:hypothetical protein n=1 Tax=Flavobacterium sp. 3HN19-14 TaxID=3448133 RepID=UPI003EE06D79
MIGAIDFLSKYGDREEYLRTITEEEKPTYNEILSNINNRKSINWSEFDEVLNLFLGEDPLRKVLYNLKSQNKIEITVDDIHAKKIIVDFLKHANATYSSENDNLFLVNLEISNN